MAKALQESEQEEARRNRSTVSIDSPIDFCKTIFTSTYLHVSRAYKAKHNRHTLYSSTFTTTDSAGVMAIKQTRLLRFNRFKDIVHTIDLSIFPSVWLMSFIYLCTCIIIMMFCVCIDHRNKEIFIFRPAVFFILSRGEDDEHWSVILQTSFDLLNILVNTRR